MIKQEDRGKFDPPSYVIVDIQFVHTRGEILNVVM
jgi:hypothetical protein